MHCPRRAAVSGRQKDPLRPLTSSERRALEQLARSQSAPALSVARARALLAVSEGWSYTEAALLVGRAVGDSIAQWVTLFNQLGLAAVERQPGGRPPTLYAAEERERIVAEFRRPPDRERDGTATWSLNTLQRALRRAPDGLPKVSTYTTCLSVVCHSILACSSEAHESVTHCGGSSGITPSGISRLE